MVVDDDPNIRELVSTLLKNANFEVCGAKSGRECLDKMLGENPDLCVIDLMMPNMDGYELCGNIQKYHENTPVLMLTAKAELRDKIKGFELGTDDYLTKPFEGEELIARVRALLRRYKIESSQIIQIADLTIDKNSFTVNNEDIPRKEFELLFKLAGFPNRTFSRDQLIEDIWGYDFEGNERTLDVHIGRLRERFPAIKIATVRGLGYRLEAVK
ncbi:MAG: response regulator transcription factor [Clostridiales bacterium]|nr:response regulator transcription factor [Clostridiales bacterium]